MAIEMLEKTDSPRALGAADARHWIRLDRTSPLPFRTESDRYYDLLGLDTAALERALLAEIQEEHEQPDAQRYVTVLSRLTAWLELSLEDARILAASWDRVLRSLPDSLRDRTVEAERGAILNGLSFADFQRLATILPWLREEAAATPALVEPLPLAA